MSEQKPRLPLFALGAAVLAVTVSVIAAVVVVTRDDDSANAKRAGSASSVIDQRVSASDVIRLRDNLDVFTDAGQPHGVRVRDEALAASLGLEPDDTLLVFGGRPITRVMDVTDMLLRAASMRVTTLYVEIERDGKPTLLRWHVDGTLLDLPRDVPAGSAAIATGPSLGPAMGSAGSATPFLGSPVDMLDQIEKIDDTHYRVRRDTAAAMIREATLFKHGARYVPSLKNGKPDGYKLFSIRPGSVFDKVGFQNADTVHAINGATLADVDDLVSLMNDAKRKVKEFRFDITRGGQPLSLHIELAP